MTRRSLILSAVLAPALLAKKKYKHPKLGFTLELPDGWTTEDAEVGVTLMPPGVTISPDREDNPEVYTVWSPQDDQSSEQDYIQGIRARFRGGKVAVEREGDIERFAQPRTKKDGISGVIYTFDFVHPERKAPYRLRAFAMTTRGRQLILIAQGVKEKVSSRDAVLRQIAGSLYW